MHIISMALFGTLFRATISQEMRERPAFSRYTGLRGHPQNYDFRHWRERRIFMFNFTNTKTHQEVPANTNPALAEGKVPSSKQEDPVVEQRLADIEAQRLAFIRKNPDFDMKTEMNNPAFINYLCGNGLTVEDAYFLVHREEMLEAARQEGAKTVLSRKERVLENGTAKSRPAITKKNPKDLSDKEVDAIIERAKKGETITF